MEDDLTQQLYGQIGQAGPGCLDLAAIGLRLAVWEDLHLVEVLF